MGNEIVAARSTELLALHGHYLVPADNHTERLMDDAGSLLGSAVALLRKELDRAGAPAIGRVDPDMADRIYGIYGLLLMVKGMSEAVSARMVDCNAEG